jgi:hypothetical protein
VDITFTTYERSFIQAFGPRLHEVVTGDFPVKQAFPGVPAGRRGRRHHRRRHSRGPHRTADSVDPAVPEAYRVGTGKVWRLGKKALGLYLPMRFGRGQPFHADAPWRAIELGLRAGSRWLAS